MQLKKGFNKRKRTLKLNYENFKFIRGALKNSQQKYEMELEKEKQNNNHYHGIKIIFHITVIS